MQRTVCCNFYSAGIPFSQCTALHKRLLRDSQISVYEQINTAISIFGAGIVCGHACVFCFSLARLNQNMTAPVAACLQFCRFQSEFSLHCHIRFSGNRHFCGLSSRCRNTDFPCFGNQLRFLLCCPAYDHISAGQRHSALRGKFQPGSVENNA